MAWTTLLGHAREITRLRTGAAAGRIAHAYAFAGPAGIGKRRVALEFANCLLCDRYGDAELDACGECASCRQVVALTHPDLITLGLPEGKRELPLKLFIGEDENRGKEGLCHDLSLKPMSARRRVAIIDAADAMTEEASNSLLKTLEEPPPHSVLILIAASVDQLLPTIRSRCQVVTFQPLPAAAISELLIRTGLAASALEATQIAGLCDGSLETARQLLDPELRNLRDELHKLLAADPFRSVQTAERMIECLDSTGAEKSSQRESAGWIVRFCIEFFRQALLAVAGGPPHRTDALPHASTFVNRLGGPGVEAIDMVAGLIERCLNAERQLAGNAAIPLCLESLFDDLGRGIRGG
jgi:DNA polymerase-3 subunit delta'